MIRTHPVRVIISLREEFLGELSVFDGRLPDVYENHHRLKQPNRAEAASIIRLTVKQAGASIADRALDELVRDLARASPTLGDERSADNRPGDFVSPPFLQISCYRIWERQARAASGSMRFLEGYRPGDAGRELDAFFQEQLGQLGGWRRYVASSCLNTWSIDTAKARADASPGALGKPVRMVPAALDQFP